MNVKPESYTIQPRWMITDYHLKGTELDVYCLIWGFSQDEQGCYYGSVRYIAEYYEISTRTVERTLAALEEKGLLRKWQETINGVTVNRYMALRPEVKAAGKDPRHSVTPDKMSPVTTSREDPRQVVGQTPDNLSPKKENNNKAHSKGASATRFSPPKVEEVWAYFRERGLPPASAQTEADKFIDRYEANGWIVGKTKMKDWKAAARNWLRNRKEWGQTAAQPAGPYGGRTWEDL